MINNHKMLRNDGNVIRLKISSNSHVKSMTQITLCKVWQSILAGSTFFDGEKLSLH